MKFIRTLIFVSGFFFIASAHAEIDAPFDRLQGNAWALVLTGPEDAPFYIEQMALLEPQAETLKTREMVVIHFHGRRLRAYPDLSAFDYKLPSLNGSKKGTSTHKKINALEDKLQTDDDIFSVVLVNKQGLTQQVWKNVVQPRDIYYLMDNPEAALAPLP